MGVLVSGVNLDAIEKDMSTDQLKGDKFVLRIKYSDYAGNEFIFTSEFLSMGKYNEYSLTTLRQFEESVI